MGGSYREISPENIVGTARAVESNRVRLQVTVTHTEEWREMGYSYFFPFYAFKVNDEMPQREKLWRFVSDWWRRVSN